MVYPVNVYKNFFRVLDYQYLAEKWKRSLMSCQKKEDTLHINLEE